MDRYQIIAIILLVLFILLVIVLTSRARIIKTYDKYLRVGNKVNMTGKEIAVTLKHMLGLDNLKFALTDRKLGDAFSPKHNTLILSEEVCNTASLASLAIVSHEFGHALQYEHSSGLLFINQLFGKITRFTNKLITPTFIIGLFLFAFKYPNETLGSTLMIIAGSLFLLHMLHKTLTIPLEYNASHRALKFIKEYKLVSASELRKAKKLLRTAALTYVASLFDDLKIFNIKRKRR